MTCLWSDGWDFDSRLRYSDRPVSKAFCYLTDTIGFTLAVLTGSLRINMCDYIQDFFFNLVLRRNVHFREAALSVATKQRCRPVDGV